MNVAIRPPVWNPERQRGKAEAAWDGEVIMMASTVRRGQKRFKERSPFVSWFGINLNRFDVGAFDGNPGY
jgi:hypothetical protein